jgi:hypothetical protein
MSLTFLSHDQLNTYEGISKSFRLAAWSKWHSSLSLGAVVSLFFWVSLVSFAAITLCVASQQAFTVVVYFVMDLVRKLLVTPSYFMHAHTMVWTIGVLGFNSRQGLGIFLFITASRPALLPTQPAILLPLKFCRHDTLCCFSRSNTKCKCIFRFRLSPETFGYNFVYLFIMQWPKMKKHSWYMTFVYRLNAAIRKYDDVVDTLLRLAFILHRVIRKVFMAVHGGSLKGLGLTVAAV